MHPRIRLEACVVVVLCAFGWANAQTTNAPNIEQIVQSLAQRNADRAAKLKGYTGTRVYRLEYRGFPHDKDAEMTVEAHFDAARGKEFRVLSESGSKLIADRVFSRLLASEQEALEHENQQETAMTSQNYGFSLAREEDEEGHHLFVLRAEPRRTNKFLFRGLVWVDASDYAVTRIEGEPAKNPSFWIRKTSIHHRYTKVGDFWLPAQNISRTEVRLGGTATLSIAYRDYVVSTMQGD